MLSIIAIRNSDQHVTSQLTPRQVALYLWGRSINDFTIHIQKIGVYVPTSSDVTSLEEELTKKIKAYGQDSN